MILQESNMIESFVGLGRRNRASIPGSIVNTPSIGASIPGSWASIRWIGAILLWTGFFFQTVLANNLQLKDVRLEDEQTISFEVNWDNSWHLTTGPGNHDAVWIFAKLRGGDGAWSPLQFSTSGIGFSSAAPDLILATPVSDGLGVFLKRSHAGSGKITNTRVTLQLASPLADGAYALDIFGVEMVWIPEGPYWLGDGSSNFSLGESSTQAAVQVIDEFDINLGPDPGFTSGNSTYPPNGLIPEAYPKGTNGFYCMKYEISQEQYVDFLNHLTVDQQASRTTTGPYAEAGTHAFTHFANLRNGIRVYQPGSNGQPAIFGCDLAADGTFNSEEDAQNRACNFLNWDDLLAYFDWAGLSPMTELEYEKACRGPLAPFAEEFAWGTDAVMDANTLLQDGTGWEAVAESPSSPVGLASHGYDGPQGPLRCGFAAQAGSDRLQSGASYYGVMEMSGNLWEQCVNAGPEGVSFTGNNGNGLLDAGGNADVSGWPGSVGGGYRGGGWNSGILPGFRDLAVSDRYYSGLAPTSRRGTSGGRGVRR